MSRIVWSPQSLRDVEAIRAYIAEDSPHYADLTVRRIVAVVERLTDFPSRAGLSQNAPHPSCAKSSSADSAWFTACKKGGSRLLRSSGAHAGSRTSSDRRLGRPRFRGNVDEALFDARRNYHC